MYANIERCCQLHETVEIVYAVDHYAVRLLTSDKVVLEAKGPTVEEAMRHLDWCLTDITLDQVRSLLR
jgi:hypothetical protein